jgi:AcrR family transcriptional regulator
LGTRARREREKEERRQSILKAARGAFFEEGFHRATVDSVAERAEVSKGTVYLYFDSKETLLAALLLEGLDTLVDQLAAATASEPELPADDQLRRIGEAYLRFFQEEPQYFRLMMSMDRGRFLDSVDPTIYQQVLEASIQGLNLVVEAIERGIKDELFTCCNALQGAATLWATLNGVLELMAHPLRQEMIGIDTEELYRIGMETVIRGLQDEPLVYENDQITREVSK